MADVENRRGRRAAPGAADGDGQAGDTAVAAEADAVAAGEGSGEQPVVTAEADAVAAGAGTAQSFADVETAARQAEEAEGMYGRRICKVFCTAEKLPELWHGTFGSAPVESGPAGYTFSDGETVTL